MIGRLHCLQIREAEFVGYGEHLGFVIRDLLLTDFMYLLRCQISCRALADQKCVERLAIGERPDAGFCAAFRFILGLKELAEAGVSGQNLAGDGVRDRLFVGGLIGWRHARRELLDRQGEWRVFGFLGGDGVGLHDCLIDEIFRDHAVVVHASHQVRRDLFEGCGDFFQTRDVVVVILLRIKTELGDESRQGEMQTVHLADGHLPGLELGCFLSADKITDEDVFAQLLLVAEVGGVDGAKAIEEGAAAIESGIVGFDGVVAELIVIALVADHGRHFRRMLELIFPVVGENLVQVCGALSGWLRSVSRVGKAAGKYWCCQEEGEKAHARGFLSENDLNQCSGFAWKERG